MCIVSFSFSSWPIAQLFIDIFVCASVSMSVCVCGIHCGLGVRVRCSVAQTSSVDACVLELEVNTVEFNENLTVNNRSIAYSKRHTHCRIEYW